MQLSRPTTFTSTAMRAGLAALVASLLAIATFASAGAQQVAPTLEQLRNATYPTPYRASKSITLVDGKFDSVAEHVNMTLVDVMFGTLNGVPVAVVHTATNTGGSGVFSEIYVVDANLKPFGPGFLGDRLKNVKVQVVDNKVLVDMITQGPTEPMCCGTAPARQTWEILNGTLTRTAFVLATVDPAPPIRPAATGNAGPQAGSTSPTEERFLLALAVIGLVVLARQSTPERVR